MSMKQIVEKSVEVGHRVGENKGKVVSVALVTGIVALVFMFEDRYALAKDVQEQQQSIQHLGKQQANTNTFLKLQVQMRKTILEMKKAQQGLSAAETVELNSLPEQIKALDN